MRIVAGRNRGKLLAEPEDRSIRPSSDRLRESVFNILYNHGLPEGAMVLDVFAGTGAIGLEAFSRGAVRVALIEKDAAALKLIAENVKRVRGEGACIVLGRDATKPGAPPPGFKADVVFLDPPYGKGLSEQALAALDAAGWLSPGVIVIAEHERREEPVWPAGFVADDRRAYGKGAVTFLSRG